MKKEKPTTKTCKHCKTEMPIDEKVCPNCGKKQPNGLSHCNHCSGSGYCDSRIAFWQQ